MEGGIAYEILYRIQKTQDQMSGFIRHETYLKLIEQPGMKVCIKLRKGTVKI